MSRVSKLLGSALVVLGLGVLVTFAVLTVRDEDYEKAAMLSERNPGNVMYESQVFVATVRRAIFIGVASGGGLLALNGTTLFLIGVLAGRQRGRGA
jgi:hypothetical protein